MNTIISNTTLFASAYAEALSGLYPRQCDTLDETIDYLRGQRINIGRGYALSEIPYALSTHNDRHYVFVEFSLESDYTKHETRLMPVQKRYLPRVKKFMNDFESA